MSRWICVVCRRVSLDSVYSAVHVRSGELAHPRCAGRLLPVTPDEAVREAEQEDWLQARARSARCRIEGPSYIRGRGWHQVRCKGCGWLSPRFPERVEAQQEWSLHRLG